MTERKLTYTRIEHLRFTIDGNPDSEVLKERYRVVIYSVRTQGSKTYDHIDWVGEVRHCPKEISALHKVAEKNGGVFNHKTPTINIYTSVSSR